jgi:hypothetical protein
MDRQMPPILIPTDANFHEEVLASEVPMGVERLLNVVVGPVSTAWKDRQRSASFGHEELHQFRAFEAQPTNRLTLEIVTMDAHSLSLQYELAAIAGPDVPNPSRDRFDGDFAAGVRALEPDAGVRGDFATGMRGSTPLFMTTGDFATGLRADPAAGLVRGDFATGQRTGRSDTSARSDQPGRRGRSPLWPDAAVAPRAA